MRPQIKLFFLNPPNKITFILKSYQHFQKKNMLITIQNLHIPAPDESIKIHERLIKIIELHSLQKKEKAIIQDHYKEKNKLL